MDAMVLTGLAVLVTTVVASGLMLVLMRTGLERNDLIGLRTRATKASDEAWRVGHAAARPVLVAVAVSGVILLVTTALAYAISRPERWPAAAVAGPGAVLTFGMLIYASVLADRAAKRVQATSPVTRRDGHANT